MTDRANGRSDDHSTRMPHIVDLSGEVERAWSRRRAIALVAPATASLVLLARMFQYGAFVALLTAVGSVILVLAMILILRVLDRRRREHRAPGDIFATFGRFDLAELRCTRFFGNSGDDIDTERIRDYSLFLREGEVVAVEARNDRGVRMALDKILRSPR
jgi:hypothetical protein